MEELQQDVKTTLIKQMEILMEILGVLQNEKDWFYTTASGLVHYIDTSVIFLSTA